MIRKITATLRRLLPAQIFSYARSFYWICRRIVLTIPTWLRYGRPDMSLFFGVTPGDELLCTAVHRELNKRDIHRVWMFSNYPEIYRGNPDAVIIKKIDPWMMDYAKLTSKYIHLGYSATPVTDEWGDSPHRHLIAEMCHRLGMQGRVVLRPYLELTENEKQEGAWAAGKLVIQSSGLAARMPMQNKNWYPERYQQVIDALRGGHEFIQIGSTSDPLLEGVTDLRGKTSIRSSAAILFNARLNIGHVGFLMHLARAMECPSVIIYGGREAPWLSGYSCNYNIYTKLPCSPCWLWNRCDFNHECMRKIEASHVIGQIKIALATPRMIGTVLPSDETEL